MPRVPAHEIEIAVLGAVRARLRQDGSAEPDASETQRGRPVMWPRIVV
jgi:hypothetical protein